MSRVPDHLRHDVLNKHPLVDLKPLREYAVVDVLRQELPFVKGHADEKSGVSKIALKRRAVGIQTEPHVGLARSIRDVDRHRLLQPLERRLVVTHFCAGFYFGQHKLLFVPRELRRYRVEHGGYLVPERPAVLVDVRPVEGQDVALHRIDPTKVVRSVELGDGLRHPAHDKILPEQVHQRVVHLPSKRSFFAKAL